MNKRKFKDGPLPGLDHYLLVIEGERRTVTLAYPITIITPAFVILEMANGYLGFMMNDLPGGDVLPMVGAREAYKLKDAIKQGLIDVLQPPSYSAEAALNEMLKDIDEAVEAVLEVEGGSGSPYIH